MTPAKQTKEKYLKLLQEKSRRIRFNHIEEYYPEDGPLSRHNYPKHIAFFNAGAKFSERCIMAANRIGKSEGIGAYEITLHATGKYPTWWKGKRFSQPIKAWAAGSTGTTARDIVQYKLLGQPEEQGTGMIPGDLIVKTTPKAGGVPNAVDTILVRHISGGLSRIKIKSYAEGRKSFEGTEQEIIWLDEECPLSIYTECVTRTMTTNGHIIFTFTPLAGQTKTVKQFMPGGKIKNDPTSSKILIQATWDDAPHITEKQKRKLFASLPPHEQDARSKGVPSLGSGAIYPVLESDITCDPFELPDYHPRVYGMDVGWNRTAAVWAAIDESTKTIYIYSEYYRGKAEPIIHAEGIKSRGSWIRGVIDPAADKNTSQIDGKKSLKEYQKLGLKLKKADNAVETGIQKVWLGLSTGRIKIFKSCVNLLNEYRQYCRDENGKIVKEDDHLMDSLRYLIMSGLKYAKVKPAKELNNTAFWDQVSYSPRDSVVGI